MDNDVRTATIEHDASDLGIAPTAVQLLVKRIQNDFTYHSPTEDQVEAMRELREDARRLALKAVGYCPIGRELSDALTHLEKFTMMVNAGIVRQAKP